MEDRDRVAEAGPEAADGLRRERDLGHEHDRPEPPLERRRGGLEVDLGLAAAGRPVEQEVAAAAVERADDPRERRLLVGAQRVRRGLALERLPLDRRRLLLAALPPHRRDQLERARRRRAVVVREPERQIDERRRQLVHDALHRQRLDPGRRRVSTTSTTTPRARERPNGTETTAPLPAPSGSSYVNSRARERARGHERDDRPERARR